MPIARADMHRIAAARHFSASGDACLRVLETAPGARSEARCRVHAGLEEGRTRRPVLRVNNIYGMFRAAASGLGIAALPDYMGRLADHLTLVLPDFEGPTFTAYFVYPEELRHSKRVAVLRDFLLQTIEHDRR